MYQEVHLEYRLLRLKLCPVLKVLEELQDKHSKVMQNAYRLKPLAVLM